VRHRHQRHDETDLLGQAGTPEASGAYDDVGGDDPVGGLDAGHLPAVIDDAEHLGVRTEGRAARDGRLSLGLDGADRLYQTVGGGVESAEDAIDVDERVHFRTLARGQ
jgi:hypothetical protein